jgi:FkbM family methyltransferase
MAFTCAQEGEDRILARMLERRKPGFYVDVGSHHPIRFSNTFLLYLGGWRGIVIDPAPGSTELFRRVRPRDIILNVAVGHESGRLPYFEFNETALNTMVEERARQLVDTTDYRLVRESVVPVERLDRILERHVPPGISVDLLTVDTEGYDEAVLASNDWDAFRPGIVVAELLGMMSLQAVQNASVSRMLAGYGYSPFAKAVNSVIYVMDP